VMLGDRIWPSQPEQAGRYPPKPCFPGRVKGARRSSANRSSELR